MPSTNEYGDLSPGLLQPMKPLDFGKFEQLKATGDLPSPKGSALAVIRLTQKGDTSIDELARVIKPDPAFVGRLIKAANSVATGPHRPVVSVHDALIVLGLPAVRSLALAFSLLSNYRQGGCRNFDYQRFWSHSVVCAASLQALTQHTNAAPPEEAFSVGLLSRIGCLAMATLFPNEYSELLEHISGDAGDGLSQLESQAFVMTHSELTASMFLDWGLPKTFAEPVLYHEIPDQAPFAEGSRRHTLVWSLALAQGIADACLAVESDRRLMMPRLFVLASKISIGSEELISLCNRMVREWLDWCQLLQLRAESLPPFEELLQPREAWSGGAETGDTRLKILVVDDDPAVRAVLKGLLGNAGHEVLEAGSGEAALEAAIADRPQLMIVDWLMPGMDGLQLTRALREMKIGRGIYIIVLTSLEDEEKLIEAFESGADDFISKPLRPRVLSARLRAGQRVVELQEEIGRDREEIRHFAAELAVTNARLQEAAMTDFLTNFPNRRYAMERLEQEWASSARGDRPLSCLVVDVDGFKTINDAHGHDVGDTVLKQTSAALKRGLRAHDVVARTGGDEFLVICPDTNLKAALACAERVRKAVASAAVVAGAIELHASVSIGVGQRSPDMTDSDALVKLADQGLYRAKAQGRNQIGTCQEVD